DHLSYVKKLRLAENPDRYARYIGELHTKLEELYSLYYEISQKEKCEISKDNAKGIIQELLNMSLTDD
ncbi:12882_t:CDS:2, partial [Funneliformis mosseae]